MNLRITTTDRPILAELETVKKALSLGNSAPKAEPETAPLLDYLAIAEITLATMSINADEIEISTNLLPVSTKGRYRRFKRRVNAIGITKTIGAETFKQFD